MGKNLHLSETLLRQIHLGQVTGDALIRHLGDHLGEHCSRCREALESYYSWVATTYRSQDDATRDMADTGLREDPLDSVENQTWLESLQQLPSQQRLSAILTSHPLTLSHVDALIDAARSCLPGDGSGSLEWSRAAELALHGVNPDYGRRALALAYRANALRILDSRAEAARLFSQIHDIAVNDQPFAPEIRGELSTLEASLALDHRNLGAAENLLNSAIRDYEAAEDEVRVARAMLKLAIVYDHQDRLDEAIRCTRWVCGKLDPHEHTKLFVYARVNMAIYLFRKGEYMRAYGELIQDDAFFEQLEDPWLSLRVSWLIGRIEAARGNYDTAEKTLLRVRHGFIARAVGFDVAMVNLDLALIYREQSRGEELKTLAHEMLILFETQDIHREAMAALLMFHEAVERQTLTTATIARLREYFEEIQRNPHATIQAPPN